MNTDSYILAGFNVLINTSVIVSGETVDCVYNELSYSNRKDYTFVDESECSIMVRTKDLANHPKNYLGKNVVVNDETWKIIKVKSGNVTSTFILASPNKG